MCDACNWPLEKKEEVLPKAVTEFYNCTLLHQKTPFITGKTIWSIEEKKWISEVLWICKECKKTI